MVSLKYHLCLKKSISDQNKKHSQNADTSTSMTFDLVVWHWPFIKVKKADVIRCHLLHCTLVPGMMSMGLIICVFIFKPAIIKFIPKCVASRFVEVFAFSEYFLFIDVFNCIFQCFSDDRWQFCSGTKGRTRRTSFMLDTVHSEKYPYKGNTTLHIYLTVQDFSVLVVDRDIKHPFLSAVQDLLFVVCVMCVCVRVCMCCVCACVCVCVYVCVYCVCVSVCLSVGLSVCLWTFFQQNRWTDSDLVWDLYIKALY